MTLQRPRTTFVLLSLCLIVVFDSLLSPNFQTSVHDFVRENGNNILIDDSVGDDERAVLLGIEIESLIKDLELDENNNKVNRLEIMEEGFGGDDYDLNYMSAQQRNEMGGKTSLPNSDTRRTYHNLIDSKLPLPPYNLKGVVDSTLIYNGALAILVYDPADDKFILSYSTRHPWHAENDKMLEAFKVVSYLLRKLFPERFQGVNSPEFAMAISAGTYPHVTTTDCVKQAFQTGLEEQPCVESHFTTSPVLHFGPAFSNENMYPNIIPMPAPGTHLDCFQLWSDTETICDELRHLVYGDEGLSWDRLTAEVMWRGEDYGYMANVPPGQKLSYKGLRSTIYKGKDSISIWEKDKNVPLAFQEGYSTLLSRWKGVLLTIQSVADWKRNWEELGKDHVPWCNIRFNRYEKEVGYSKEWEQLKKIGIPVVGDRIGQEELSKYNIDLGSDAWELQLQQLAKPGLLFHHVSPTKNLIDDRIEPWVHYIPVAPQLDDLKAKFDWAESHPVEAKNIASRGTEFVRYLTSRDGFAHMFQEDLVEPLRQVIEAYQPLTRRGHKNWRKEIDKVYADSILPIMKCNGRATADCERLVGEKAFASTDLKRKNCQIIYIIGVEGSSHHGFLPIIKSLAAKQIDPDTGLRYDVDETPEALKAGLFGWYPQMVKQKWKFLGDPGVQDPALVQSIVSSMCPNDGKRHVVIEWASFPSGHENDSRSYRIHRQNDWLNMTPQEIANDKNAVVHPVDLNAFYDAYAPRAEIKFVVLNRDYTETIASHKDWDGGPVTHSKIISGFMIILSRFLNRHVDDSVTGTKLWTLLCLESIFAKNYRTLVEVNEARRHVLHDLATFLDWPVKECPDCFNRWHESTKVPELILGSDNMKIIFDHMTALEGIWPPKRSDDTMPEQQCGLLTKKVAQALEPPASASTPVTIYMFGTRGKKAQSMFHTGLLGRFGTGRVEYILEQQPHCEYSELAKQHDAPCLAINYFAFQKCSYDDIIRQYPKCKTMLTNDENCADNRYDARGYYSSTMIQTTYLPLGPRYDTWDALMNQNGSIITVSSQRKYAYNAIFAKSTHAGRSNLADIIQKEGNSLTSFVKISSSWQQDPDALNDSVDTTTYMQVLLESTFTLAPSGHNPECFRLYEAVEAGSIPVISLDKYYREHACKDSLSHWLDSPIVIVESWNEMIPTLQKLLEEPEALDMRQADLRAWYESYMRSAVTNFETFLLSEK